jgi:hypothetical protein
MLQRGGSTLFDVFGDESAGEDFVSYAVVCIPSTEAAELGSEIAALKAAYGLSALHCRILFSPDKRLKSGLDNLTTNDVLALYSEVAAKLRSPSLRFVAARAQLSQFPVFQPADGVFPRVVFDKKTLGIHCANAALLPLTRDLGKDQLKVWPDHDGTKIEWLGRRHQASTAIGSFYDLGKGEPARVDPALGSDLPKDARRIIFEIADMVAWLSNRVVSGKHSNLHGRIKALYARLNPMQVSVQIGADGGMSVSVPNDWPARN